MNSNEKYGQTIRESLENVINHTSSLYLGKKITNTTLADIKRFVENAIMESGFYEYLKPNVVISTDASYSYGLNIQINFKTPPPPLWEDLVTMSPENEITHNWMDSTSNITGMNTSCKKCGIYKSHILTNRYKRITFSTENLSCNEVLIKDIIE